MKKIYYFSLGIIITTLLSSCRNLMEELETFSQHEKTSVMQSDSYLPDSFVILPSGTDGSAGTNATYVTFGTWPQTIKADNIEIDETKTKEQGSFTYYMGSDGCWYVKCLENACSNGVRYSNQHTVAQSSENSYKYFKEEPIL